MSTSQYGKPQVKSRVSVRQRSISEGDSINV